MVQSLPKSHIIINPFIPVFVVSPITVLDVFPSLCLFVTCK